MKSKLLRERLKWGTVAALGLALSLAPSLYKIDENISTRATIDNHSKEEAAIGLEEKEYLQKSLEYIFSSKLEEYLCSQIRENQLQTFYLSFYVFTRHLYIPHQISGWLPNFRGTSGDPWISV